MFGEWLSTVKEVSGGIANKYRRPRCDDDGYPQVRIIGTVTGMLAEKTLYLEFLDLANAPADTLAGWNTYFGANIFTSVEVVDNSVMLFGVGSQYPIGATIFPSTDNNLIAFLDKDGLFNTIENGGLQGTAIVRAELPNCELIAGDPLQAVKYAHFPSLQRFESLVGTASQGFPGADVIDVPELVEQGTSFVGGESGFGTSLKYFNAPKLLKVADTFMFYEPTPLADRVINLQSAVTIGSNFLSGNSFKYLDISACISLGAYAFDGTTGINATVKIHPALLTNANYIAFKAANDITEIVVYPEGWTSLPKMLTDTTVDLTGLNRTAVLACNGATVFDLILTLGTATTPPTIQLNGSENGVDGWRPLGISLMGVASESRSVQMSGILPAYISAVVTSVGVTIGSGYSITLKAK